MDNDFLTEQDISERASHQPRNAGAGGGWRAADQSFRKLGTLVRYGEYDLSQWMESQPSGGTRELGRIPPSKAQSSHGGVRKDSIRGARLWHCFFVVMFGGTSSISPETHPGINKEPFQDSR